MRPLQPLPLPVGLEWQQPLCSGPLGSEVFELGLLGQVVVVALFLEAAQTVAETAQSVRDIEIVEM